MSSCLISSESTYTKLLLLVSRVSHSLKLFSIILPTAVLNLAKSIPKSVLGIAHAEHVPDLTSKKDIEILSKIIESNYFKK